MIKTSKSKEFSSAFIIPHYPDGYEQEQDREKLFIADTIDGLFSQTDEDWCAIIVVDKLPKEKTRDYLVHLKQQYYPKIDVIFLEQNVSAGVCRNLGVLKALERRTVQQYFLMILITYLTRKDWKLLRKYF